MAVLEVEERAWLEKIERAGKVVALRVRHANILPTVDESDAGVKLKDAATATGKVAFDRTSYRSGRNRLPPATPR